MSRFAIYSPLVYDAGCQKWLHLSFIELEMTLVKKHMDEAIIATQGPMCLFK